MKSVKLLLAILITSVTFSSCTVVLDNIEPGITLDELVSNYDLWYVDVHRTTGNGDIPFLQKAFTVSFLNGRLYANNNIVDIGKTGNGLGVVIGNYSTGAEVLAANHRLDGAYDFRVVQLSNNEIRLDDLGSNLSYYLVGYQRNEFNYDKLFYENIEYFLQEYVAWERVHASGGTANPFDKEHFLKFTPENNTTFHSSHDAFGTKVDRIKWDFVGSYKIYDVLNHDDLKILTLNYDNGDTEEFELSVINDEKVRLYHKSSKTTYEFAGRGFIQYLRGGQQKPAVRNSGRKRVKIKREVKVRTH